MDAGLLTGADLQWSCDADVHSAVEALDGEQGLRAAIDLVPAVVISDVHMPRLDGFQLLRLLQGEAATGAVPVVLVSASFRDPAAARLAGDLGAAGYLEIPFDLTRLPAVIERAMAGGTRRGRSTVKVEPRPVQLSTVRSPPIMRHSRREMASPSPVPP